MFVSSLIWISNVHDVPYSHNSKINKVEVTPAESTSSLPDNVLEHRNFNTWKAISESDHVAQIMQSILSHRQRHVYLCLAYLISFITFEVCWKSEPVRPTRTPYLGWAKKCFAIPRVTSCGKLEWKLRKIYKENRVKSYKHLACRI